jgi:hypothetical protein
MTVSEQIIQVIDVLCAKVGIAIDWTSENVLPYVEVLCEKLVKYEIGTSIAWMAIWLALSAGSIVGIKKFKPVFKEGLERDKRNYDVDWEFATGFALFGLAILYIATIAVVGTQIMDIIKCATFPEMYVFEYVHGLINAG